MTTKWDNFEKKSKNSVRLQCGAMMINYSYSFCVYFFICGSMIDSCERKGRKPVTKERLPKKTEYDILDL